MESIYDPVMFCSSEPININEYFKKYAQEMYEIPQQNPDKTIEECLDDNIFSFIGSGAESEEQQSLLSDVCNISNLNVKGEKEQVELGHLGPMSGIHIKRLYQPYEVTPQAKLQLKSIQKLKERRKHAIAKDLSDLNLIGSRIGKKQENEESRVIKPFTEAVIYVRLFRPFNYFFNQINPHALLFDQEIALLTTNTLTQLRDKIRCSADVISSIESSHTPQQEQYVHSALDMYPSGFIYIGGTFYNDFRKANAIDYSRPIREWAEEKMKGSGSSVAMGPFKTADMDSTRIADLSNVRFGYPYVYQHQGRCEHIFMFSHARLISDADILIADTYPYHSNIGSIRSALCIMCGSSHAIWMVCDYDRLPIRQAPLCADCFHSYCYVDGQKIGTFKAYPYVDRSVLL